MLCPVCVANAAVAVAVAGATTGGGVAGILAVKFRLPAVRAMKATWRQIRSIVAML